MVKILRTLTKCWICNHAYVDGDVKVRDHCHITGKYKGSAHRDCNINIKLNHEILVILLKNYDSHLIMQEPVKFDLKINIIPNGLYGGNRTFLSPGIFLEMGVLVHFRLYIKFSCLKLF